MATTAERLAEYERLFNQSQQYDLNQYQEDYDKAYGEAVQYNKPIIEERQKAIAQSQSLPSELRNQYYTEGAIRNPLAQEALIAQRRAPVTSEIGSLTDLLTARKARQQDVLASQLGAYQTEAQKAQTAMENAYRMYQDAVQQEQFDRQLAANRGGGGTTGTSSALLNYLLGQGEKTPQQVDPRQGVMNMISDLAARRQVENIEGAKIDSYVRNIQNVANKYGLRLNEQAIWQQLGNAMDTPISLELFMR